MSIVGRLFPLKAGNGSAASKFWMGEFGNNYTRRVDGEDRVEHRETFFRLVFGKMPAPVQSVIEFRANRGLNIRAIKRFASPSFAAVEINELAVAELNKIDGVNAIHGSMLDFDGTVQHDLSMSVGALSHIPPADLPEAYDAIFTASGRHILIAEFFSGIPMAVEFKGRKDVMWKRDFASEMLDRYPDRLAVLDYGFLWNRDPIMPLHNLTWFLMEKHRL